MKRSGRMVLATAALLAAGCLASPVAAQERVRNGTAVIATERGTATVNRSSVAGEDGRSGSATIAGANGRTATRDFARRYVRGQGVTAQSTLTGPDGRSRSTVREAGRAGPRAIGRSRQVTGPRGETRPQRRWVRIRSPR